MHAGYNNLYWPLDNLCLVRYECMANRTRLDDCPDRLLANPNIYSTLGSPSSLESPLTVPFSACCQRPQLAGRSLFNFEIRNAINEINAVEGRYFRASATTSLYVSGSLLGT